MDHNLTNIRQRTIEKAIEFIQAQRAYIKATGPDSRVSKTARERAAEEFLKAAALYETALWELHQYLLEMEPSEAITAEIERTERLIDALDKEKVVGSKLITHHSSGQRERR